MHKVECLVIGGGPAGLAAAIEAANNGVKTLVIDENPLPGGQLFKQIHKFFGSQEHKAGIRGFVIGQQLLAEAKAAGVEVSLNTRCWGIFDNNIIGIVRNGKSEKIEAKKVIIATGASENALSFPGCTLPGVMTAGAAQTCINVHRVLPGEKVIMIGTGNVGLIVAYQLMQAGAEVVAIIEAAPQVGGYDVHANKIRRASVPIYLSHTVIEAKGNGQVEKAVIAPVDNKFEPDKSRAFEQACDTICFAVGLTPRIELPQMAGVPITFHGVLGGHMPLHDENLKVKENFFIAGDLAGVEEASTAMEEGRLAGLAVAIELGYVKKTVGEANLNNIKRRLSKLRSGQFGIKRATAKAEIHTRESAYDGNR